MKYFRYYPWGLQLVLFILMVFTLLSFASWTAPIIISRVYGIDATQLQFINEHSSHILIMISQLLQGFLSLFFFCVPPLLFAYLTHPSPSQYLGLRAPGRAYHWLLVILMMLSVIPLLEGIETFVGKIDFGPALKDAQAQNDAITTAYLNMPTTNDFLRTFAVMAIIPALGEELFFRGIMMRFAMKISRRLWVSFIFSAVLFASLHGNIYGLPSIFIAGLLLAGIYYLTGSLLCSMVAHLCFNGLQIVLAYLSKTNVAAKNIQDANTVQLSILLPAAAIFAASFYMLWRTRTPLAKNWTNDFNYIPKAESQTSTIDN